VRNLALKVEFELPEHHTAALQDEDDFTIFVYRSDDVPRNTGVALTFQVADVEATFKALSAAGTTFAHPPQRVFWGYGAELSDPDGYAVRLWDERTMREKGST
jgi:predicted enzyme related to lactoylglutathione lyase